MKKILIVARNNTYGLTQDSEILKQALLPMEYDVAVSTPKGRNIVDWFLRRQRYDLIFHLERIFPRWVSAGRCNILIPNQERFPKRHVPRLRLVDMVWAKTRHSEEVFRKHHKRTEFSGFGSVDRRVAGLRKDWKAFFHLAGGSTLKGTEDLIELWRKHPEWPKLVLVQKAQNAPRNLPENVELHSGYIEDSELIRLQNICGIHLCPSRAEGWGHSIVEAMSCGAVVVVTDAPPMNEHLAEGEGIFVGWSRSEARHLGTQYFVDIVELERAVLSILEMHGEELERIGAKARKTYEKSTADFAARLRKTDFA